jgi:hypothetical protein
MAANILNSESGQGLVEVILVIPLFFLMVGILYHVNLAAQVAINNVQYARTQLFQLASNQPEYPRMEWRRPPNSSASMDKYGHSMVILGVNDPSAAVAAEEGDALEPIPTEENIARSGTQTPGSDAPGEVERRTKVRIRTTVAICTQASATKSNGKWTAINPQAFPRNVRWPLYAGGTPCTYGGNSL